jgi:hypothetical protein
MSTSQSSFPIGFDLYNADEEQVLYITDNVAGQELTLEITNTSDQPTTPQLLLGFASETNYHFELQFRPGTVFNNPSAIIVEGTQFEMYANKDNTGAIIPNADGTLSLYFRSTSTWTLNPGERLTIPLNRIRAESGEGTRSTRVLLTARRFSRAIGRCN